MHYLFKQRRKDENQDDSVDVTGTGGPNLSSFWLNRSFQLRDSARAHSLRASRAQVTCKSRDHSGIAGSGGPDTSRSDRHTAVAHPLGHCRAGTRHGWRQPVLYALA
jgi:hypothetical protein